MTSSHTSDVLALVAAHGWHPDQVRAVRDSLAGQVGHVQVLSPSSPVTAEPPDPGLSPAAEVAFVLVVTSPVVFAGGAVHRLLRERSEERRVGKECGARGAPSQ